MVLTHVSEGRRLPSHHSERPPGRSKFVRKRGLRERESTEASASACQRRTPPGRSPVAELSCIRCSAHSFPPQPPCPSRRHPLTLLTRLSHPLLLPPFIRTERAGAGAHGRRDWIRRPGGKRDGAGLWAPTPWPLWQTCVSEFRLTLFPLRCSAPPRHLRGRMARSQLVVQYLRYAKHCTRSG